MAKAFIGFGGNVGDTRQIITDAMDCLALRSQLQIIYKSCLFTVFQKMSLQMYFFLHN